MKINNRNTLHIAATAIAALALSACATAIKDPGADRARASLSTLQGNPELASRAPVAIKEAEAAVVAAETPQDDAEKARQLAYTAEQKVAIAQSQAERRFEEDRLKTLGEERERVRLDARTSEADAAKLQAQAALSDAQRQQLAAQEAMGEANKARAEAEALKAQIAELNAKQTDRGLVMTLGDVLFATGKADLQPGAMNNLGKLVQFLNQYPDRTLAIEGHTDNVGSDDLNLGLSQRRAESVKGFLIGQGVAVQRVTAMGKGEAVPVASNDNAAGRQQNRRVEIIISN